MTKGFFNHKKGLEKARENLLELERKFKEVLSQKGEAAETGGNAWHDNPAFEDLISQEQMIGFRINELKDMIRNAQTVEESIDKETVRIESVVILSFDDNRNIEYKITDSLQADPGKNLISYSSPLGSAILGAKRGESREFIAGNKKRRSKFWKLNSALWLINIIYLLFARD